MNTQVPPLWLARVSSHDSNIVSFFGPAVGLTCSPPQSCVPALFKMPRSQRRQGRKDERMILRLKPKRSGRVSHEPLIHACRASGVAVKLRLSDWGMPGSRMIAIPLGLSSFLFGTTCQANNLGTLPAYIIVGSHPGIRVCLK